MIKKSINLARRAADRMAPLLGAYWITLWKMDASVSRVFPVPALEQ